MIAQLSRRIPTPTSAEATNFMWFGLASIYILVLTVGMASISYNIWGALVLGPVLTTLTLPVLRRSVMRDDPSMVRLITFAFIAKMFGAIMRYVVTFGVYGDNSDASQYHDSGSILAMAFWEGRFSEAFQQQVPDLMGTEFIRLLTGLLYIVTGPTMLGGFLVFSLISFWGLYFFYRALRIAFPEANYRRYAYLLFFLPSLLYWPSSLGKEAWMTGTIGLATYGVALILKHNPLGYPYAAFGLIGTGLARPHITALCFVSLFFAYMLRRKSWREARFGPFGKAAGIAVMLVAGGVVLSTTAGFFDVSGDAGGVDQVLQRTQTQSAQGGSEFEGGGQRAYTPKEFPVAFTTVMFRPYPWEANNAQMLVAAFEGSFLLCVALGSWRRIVRLPGFIFRVPYLAYCVAYIIMFVIAFSSIGNFGIMTRQRTQVFPFVLVLLVLPLPRIDDGDDGVDDGFKLRGYEPLDRGYGDNFDRGVRV
jgi:hypothetical protein